MWNSGQLVFQEGKDPRQVLMQWMRSPENPYLSQAIANRLWGHYLGRGIVHPVDAMHTQPWNEDLLDYLALRFAAEG